jgi:hypothetical protein
VSPELYVELERRADREHRTPTNLALALIAEGLAGRARQQA